MPKGSPELTNARKEEIIAACRKLYETMSFKDITLKEIGQQTSFTRTSIYNYFETKEEIFLALFRSSWPCLPGSMSCLPKTSTGSARVVRHFHAKSWPRRWPMRWSAAR